MRQESTEAERSWVYWDEEQSHRNFLAMQRQTRDFCIPITHCCRLRARFESELRAWFQCPVLGFNTAKFRDSYLVLARLATNNMLIKLVLE